MERTEFGEMIGRICRYWDRKLPLEETALEWYQLVRWIPQGHGDRIFRGFTRMSSRPVNIPWHIQDIFRGLGVKTYNPDRIVGCDQCEEGFLWVSHPEQGRTVFRCRNCKTVGRIGIPWAYRADLLTAGWVLDRIHGIPRVFRKKRFLELNEKPRGMVESTGEIIDEMPFDGQF